MKTLSTLVILVLAAALSGCNGIVLGRGGGSGSGDTAFGVGGFSDHQARSGMTAFKNSLPPVSPYYKPEAAPRTLYVPIRPNVSQVVHVYDDSCVGGDGGAYYLDLPGIKQIHLCGRRLAEEHEAKHAAGMKHTEWEKGGGADCATITVAGYNTGYKVGERICRANDYEWKEAAK